MPVPASTEIFNGSPTTPGVVSNLLPLYGETDVELTLRITAVGTMTRIDLEALVQRVTGGQDGNVGVSSTPVAGVATLSRATWQHDLTGAVLPYEITWRVPAVGEQMRWRLRAGAGSGSGSTVQLYARRIP